MSTIVLRNVKGSPLTFTEMDNNFTNLNNDKIDKNVDSYVTTSTPGAVVTFSNVDVLPGRQIVTTASTGGFEAGAHHLQVQFDFNTTTYFSQVGGHFGLITHLDEAVVASYIRGNGVLIGTATNGYIHSADLTNPTIMIETFFGNSGAGSPEPNIVYPGSDMPIGYALQDGVNYRVIVDSCVDFNDQPWIRYRIFRKEATYLPDTIDGTAGYWLPLHDSGYWRDSNPYADFSLTGIMFYEVFSPTNPWSVAISNLEIRWGPYFGQVEESPFNRQFRSGTYQATPLFVRSDAFGPTGVADTFRMDGFDNTQLRTYATTYPNFNWSDWCDVNDIKNKLTAAGMSSTTATQVENVLRPLYCIVGQLCKQAKNRGW